MFRRLQRNAIKIYGTLIKCTIIDMHIMHNAIMHMHWCILYAYAIYNIVLGILCVYTL